MQRRRKTTEERRAEIVAAAREIITARGGDALTIENLAEAVHFTQGAVYRHFRSKAEILRLLLDDVGQSFLQSVDRGKAGVATPLEQMRGILCEHLETIEWRKGVSFVVLAEALNMADRRIRQRAHLVLHRYFSALEKILRAGIAGRSIRRDLPVKDAARAFFGIIQSTVTIWALRRYRPQLKTYCRNIWNIYEASLRNRNGRGKYA